MDPDTDPGGPKNTWIRWIRIRIRIRNTVGYKPIILLKLKSYKRYLAAHDKPPVTEESVLAGKDFPLLLGFHCRLTENQGSLIKPETIVRDHALKIFPARNATTKDPDSDPLPVALNMAKITHFDIDLDLY
jgi:hypothetical protein